MNKLSIVSPIYNEEDNINIFIERIISSLNLLGNLDYEIIFVLDPSDDNSKEIILDKIKNNKKIKLISLSRRFGQPISTLAGVKNCSGDRCVIIDCDLQDQPELIVELYNKMNEGYDVVLAKRRNRAGETYVKKMITKIGYYILNKVSDINIPRDTGDFRIISQRVINELKKLDDKSAFLRGLVSYIGFKQTHILYDRDKRLDGIGKYNKYFGSIKIALNGIVGFSSKPLFILFMTGLLTSIITGFLLFISLLFLILNIKIFSQSLIILLVVFLFMGLNFTALGLIGQYVGRIYDEVKKIPTYIIDEKINFD